MKRWAAWAGLLAILPVTAAAAAPTAELDTTVGYSTQGTAAVASQLKVFGEMRSDLRFYAEAAGAAHSGQESDAFAAAYDYRNGMEAGEAYVERQFSGPKAEGGLRVGRYRTPFGIYSGSDYAYGGFLRPPMVRYGYFGALSNYWLEGGVDGFAGTPQLQLEASLATPQEEDGTRGGLDAAVRVQGYHGPVILGASFLTTQVAPFEGSIRRSSQFAGVDGRWMERGLQFRGEWIHGRSSGGIHSQGWYVDAMLHRAGLGPVTPVMRYEEARFALPGSRMTWRRWTTGVKVRISPSLAGTVNYIQGWHGALDVGLTHTERF